jgi:large repetitive protein
LVLIADSHIIKYTIKVWNQSKTNATGVEVADQLPAGVQYVSSTASRGSYASTTGIWVIGKIAANGDTVSLGINVKVMMEGLTFNTAEISKTNEKDIDSTPGNGIENEDDIDRACFTVPVKLCLNDGTKIEASIPSSYTNVKWSDGQIGNVVAFGKAGTYTFTASNGSCPSGGCCPIIIESINCCPAQLCVPFTIHKTRK